MTNNTKTFPQLPKEVQFHVWDFSRRQSERIFELHDHDPFQDNFERRDMDIRHSRVDSCLEEPPVVRAPSFYAIADITLYERSLSIRRPLLMVDRVSRAENLRFVTQQPIKFLNTTINMNMEVDIIFYGQFHTDHLTCLFDDPMHNVLYVHAPVPQPDPFWTTVQHLAFGMNEYYRLLERTPLSLEMLAGDPYHFLNQPDDTWGLGHLQIFPALKTFTLVLDAVNLQRRDPRINGVITFGDAMDVCPDDLHLHYLYISWMSILTEKWRMVGETHPQWNVPELLIKSISRGGVLQLPDWSSLRADLFENLVLRGGLP